MVLKNHRTQKNNINKRVQKRTKRKSLGKKTRKNLRKKRQNRKTRRRRFRGGAAGPGALAPTRADEIQQSLRFPSQHRFNNATENQSKYSELISEDSRESIHRILRNDDSRTSIMIWTDPGADIDDEIALWYLVTQEIITPENTVIFIGGKGKKKELTKWSNDYCPDLLQYHIFGENDYIPPVFPTDLIIIAPGIDRLKDKLRLDNLKKVSFQGSLPIAQSLASNSNYNFLVEDDTVAFNDSGSLETIKRISENPQIVFKCVTTKECNQILPFSEDNFKRYNFPENIRESVKQTVFKNMLGRMHPKHPYKHFAEGLINPDIKGANYHLVKRVYTTMKDKMGDNTGPPNASKELKDAVDGYIGELSAAALDAKAAAEAAAEDALAAEAAFKLKPDNDKARVDAVSARAAAEFAAKAASKLKEPRSSTRDYLLEMCQWIQYIINEPPLDNDKKLINSGLEEDEKKKVKLHEVYSVGYENFKKVGIFTPAFDLLTVMRHFDITI